MTTALTRLSGSAFELTLTVPWPEIKSVYDKVFEELSAEIEVEGFRKGKAPKDLTAQKIEKRRVYDQVIKRILPDAYAKALEEHHLKPIINPKIEISQGEDDKDWQFIARAAEKPEIKLGDYQKDISNINTQGKIWTPEKGESPKEKTPEDKKEEENEKLNKIIEKLLETCIVEIPELLVESEVNRLISELVDDVRSAGMTYEQYLTTKGTDAQKVRENYRSQVVSTLKLEFILDAIANDLKIVVDEKEVETIIEKEPDAAKKQALKAQSYYLTSLLRRQKTLTKLTTL